MILRREAAGNIVEFPITAAWSRDVDALHIRFLDHIAPGEVHANVTVRDPRIKGTVVLDLDARNRVIGIEIVDVASAARFDALPDSN